MRLVWIVAMLGCTARAVQVCAHSGGVDVGVKAAGKLFDAGKLKCQDSDGPLDYEPTDFDLPVDEAPGCVGVIVDGEFQCHSLFPLDGRERRTIHVAWIGDGVRLEMRPGPAKVTYTATGVVPPAVVLHSQPEVVHEQPFYIKYWYILLPLVMVFVMSTGSNAS